MLCFFFYPNHRFLRPHPTPPHQIPKEKDESVREQVAEAVLCLSCYSEARGTLWELGVHEILRKVGNVREFEFIENL